MMAFFTILLNGMSNISNGVLQGIGKPKIPMITAAVALVVDVVVVVVLLMFTNLGIYALLVAMIVYAIVVCVLNDFFMKQYLDYKNPWKAAYVSPIVASAVMGVVAAGVYYGLHDTASIQYHLSRCGNHSGSYGRSSWYTFSWTKQHPRDFPECRVVPISSELPRRSDDRWKMT